MIDMLMRKLDMYEFEWRNILYLMFYIVYPLSISKKISGNDILFWNSKAKHPILIY